MTAALAIDHEQHLVVFLGEGARWFKVGDGALVDLSRRRKLRQVLLALVRERLRAPGQPMSIERLFADAWEGEHALPTAAAARVYVAVSTLRGMGLKRALASSTDGYFLAAHVDVELRRQSGTTYAAVR